MNTHKVRKAFLALGRAAEKYGRRMIEKSGMTRAEIELSKKLLNTQKELLDLRARVERVEKYLGLVKKDRFAAGVKALT
jgi:hypothetical protein